MKQEVEGQRNGKVCEGAGGGLHRGKERERDVEVADAGEVD